MEVYQSESNSKSTKRTPELSRTAEIALSNLGVESTPLKLVSYTRELQGDWSGDVPDKLPVLQDGYQSSGVSYTEELEHNWVETPATKVPSNAESALSLPDISGNPTSSEPHWRHQAGLFAAK